MTTRQNVWIGQLKQCEGRGLPGGTITSFYLLGGRRQGQPKCQDFGFGKKVVFLRDRWNLHSLNTALRNLGAGLSQRNRIKRETVPRSQCLALKNNTSQLIPALSCALVPSKLSVNI